MLSVKPFNKGFVISLYFLAVISQTHSLGLLYFFYQWRNDVTVESFCIQWHDHSGASLIHLCYVLRWNSGIPLKMHLFFCLKYVKEIWKKQQSPFILDLCLTKARTRKSDNYRDVLLFKKPVFSKIFPSTLKREADVFKFLGFKERFRKALFSRGIGVNGRTNSRNRAAFSKSCAVLWTWPQCSIEMASSYWLGWLPGCRRNELVR